MTKDRIVGLAVALVGLVSAPLVLPVANATELIIFALVAASANLLIGWSGLYSFGQAALFGVGGYAGGYLLANTDVALLPPVLFGGLIAAVVATGMGAMSVRRVGIYFIMLTFAFNQLVYYVAYSWQDVTGGEDGMIGIDRPGELLPWMPAIDFNNPINFYILVAVIVGACFLLLLRVIDSPFGQILLAAKDNPRRAGSVGYDIHAAQTLAFTIAGFFSGIAGVLYGMVYWIMPIDAVHWLTAGYIVFMVLVGGTSSMFGPLIGAAIFILLQDFFSTLWARWPLLFGAVIIAVVMFLRGGVIELVDRLRGVARKPGQPPKSRAREAGNA